jgi:hypothetical protein
MSATDSFDFSREGCFGSFRVDTADSQIFYVATSFGANELHHLATAKDALPADQLTFDAIIQREIIPKHVEGITRYLGQENEPRFFPPLVAALVPIEQGTIAPDYPNAKITTTSDKTNPELVATWASMAQLRLGIVDDHHSGATLGIDLGGGNTTKIVPYLARVRLNTSIAKLIVVDGQHRLRALKDLAISVEGQRRLANLAIPVIVLLFPWSKPSATRRVTATLRQIFVDINRGARAVSGHFVILLDDNDIASLVIRSFCELLRGKKCLWSMEWNEQENRLAYQLARRHSVTGVGVLYKALIDSGLPRKVSRDVFRPLLGLDQRPECAGIIDWGSPFTNAQRDALQQAIEARLVPSLFHLYSAFRPYTLIADTVKKAMKDPKLRGLSNGVKAIEDFEASSPPDAVQAKEAYSKVVRLIDERVDDIEEVNIGIYRTQRFQQGLIAGFCELFHACAIVQGEAAQPVAVAEVFTQYLNDAVASDKSDLLVHGAPWLQSIVVKGLSAEIDSRVMTRVHLRRLLLSPLAHKTRATELAGRLEKKTDKRRQLEAMLLRMGRNALSKYWSAFLDCKVQEVYDRVEYLESISEDERTRLLALRTAMNSAADDQSVATSRSAFEDGALAAVQSEVKRAQRGLEKLLGVQIHPAADRTAEDD